MVANTQTKEIYLIVSSVDDTFTFDGIRQAVQFHFGISDDNQYSATYKGLFLDGGGSSQMLARDSNNQLISVPGHDERSLYEIIALRNAT